MLSLIDKLRKAKKTRAERLRLDPKRVDLDPRGVDPEGRNTRFTRNHYQKLEHDLREVEIKAKSRISINKKGKS